MSHVRIFAYEKTKAQVTFTVTAKLISAFVLATRIVQFFLYFYPKFQDSNFFLWLHRPVCVGPGRKSRRPVFTRRGSYYVGVGILWYHCNVFCCVCFLFMPPTSKKLRGHIGLGLSVQ